MMLHTFSAAAHRASAAITRRHLATSSVRLGAYEYNAGASASLLRVCRSALITGKAAHNRTFALMAEDELKRRMDDFQDLFVEARLCIEDAQESQETTYFAEDLDAAQEAVDEAVKAFNEVVADIDDKDQKNSVLRSNGLKVEQLKGEIQMIIDGHGHHH
mmetsp:Transcript_3508/g.7622  ORF Transcript_3508/g.7622 Transcript_3508/m.7622 type:complete len:160 (+) Transcript_3508:3-482(+)